MPHALLARSRQGCSAEGDRPVPVMRMHTCCCVLCVQVLTGVATGLNMNAKPAFDGNLQTAASSSFW